MKVLSISLIILLLFAMSACKDETLKDERAEEIKLMREKIARFTPVEVSYDTSVFNERQRIVIENLFHASKLMDSVFLDQVYHENKIILNELINSDKEEDKLKLEYFKIMMGPFDRLDNNKPFIGETSKPKGANFYPDDITAEEFEEWIENNPLVKDQFQSEFTVIRRDNGDLKAILYSEYYRKYLTRAAGYLREAAKYADNPSLKKYLLLRADAFETNDYFASDVAWMDLKNHDIEVVIGPYEVYEDELLNLKASFESFITVKDSAETRKLEIFAGFLQDFEGNLPVEEKYKNKSRGLESPIVVVNEIYTGGDAKAGVQTLAFNLPNDERVRKLKGSKKVMIKNIHEAKFEKLLKPIAELIIDEEQLPFVTFNGFFNHTLMHEMSHGIGPGYITINGRRTEVKKELKENYSKIEECKADVLGMYNNIFMIKKGVFDRQFEKEIWVTALAGIFRSVRFGISEAHGAGNAIIYNYLLEKGAYEFDNAKQKVKVNFEKIYPSLEELAKIILVIQATGDYNSASYLIEKYAVNSTSMDSLRAKLRKLPVDIKPVFEIEKILDKPEKDNQE
jgi:hypothetical protein